MPTPTDIADYEKNRINSLQEQRVHVQKKTFTKWMNSFLVKANMEVSDIFVDLSDGKKLLKLLEIISGEPGRLGKPSTGQMRVHKIENLNKCLHFLGSSNVQITCIGAEDILDGNQKLILGLLWAIILRFHVKDIVYTSDSEEEEEVNNNTEVDSKVEPEPAPKPRKSHTQKEALALWCQKRTRGYSNVNVRDFTESWRDGMAFNALIHSHDPELVNYDELKPDEHIHNLNNAFEVAQKHLDIQPLLDAEDVERQPDEMSIMTYVSSIYHSIANDGFNMTDVSRIDKQLAADSTLASKQISEQLLELTEDDHDGPPPPLPSSPPPVFAEPLARSVCEPGQTQLLEKSPPSSSVAVPTDDPEQNNWLLWAIVVAVGVTILRNIFQNTVAWFSNDSVDRIEPSP